MDGLCHCRCTFRFTSSINSHPGRIKTFAFAGNVIVYRRPPRSVLGKIRCRVWDIRDQVHFGRVRDERVSRALDVRDKESNFGGVVSPFASEI